MALQTKHWDPIVAWAKQDLGAPMRLAEGVMHVGAAANLARCDRKRLAGFDALEPRRAPRHDRALGLGAACSCGSARGRLTPEAAWAAAHVDEDWQIGQWGEDEEAKERRENRRRDFAAAARMLELLRA